MDINRITITGYAVDAPDFKAVESRTGGTLAKVTFRIGCTMSKDKSIFVQVTSFGDTAAKIGTHIVKGKRIGVDGKLNISSWKDDTGAWKYYTEVIAERIVFLDKKGDYE